MKFPDFVTFKFNDDYKQILRAEKGHFILLIKNKAHATILKMGGHIREAARFTITLGANKISNFKGK